MQIEDTLNLTDSQFGFLGSLVYAGIVIMGSFSGHLFMRYNPKRILQISLIVMMISLALFTLTQGGPYTQYICRLAAGMAQAPLLIYFPIWVDIFGGKEKTLWLTFLQAGVPLGIFTGYVMSTVISLNLKVLYKKQNLEKLQWQWNFYIQVILMSPCLIGFIMAPSKNLDVRNNRKNKEIDDSNSHLSNSLVHHSVLDLLKVLYQSKVYLYIMLSLCVAYFVVTGVQFWISNYFVTVFKLPIALVNTVFSVVSITAPTLGCIFGGIIVQKLGGYESKKALPVCFICTVSSTISSFIIPYTHNFFTACVCIWFQLFFGGFQVPILTGLMISSVPHGYKAFANSTAMTCFNLFGYLPAPVIYGALSDHLDKHVGIKFLMFYAALADILQCLALYYQENENDQTKTEITKIIKESQSDQYHQKQEQKNAQNIELQFSYKQERGIYILQQLYLQDLQLEYQEYNQEKQINIREL